MRRCGDHDGKCELNRVAIFVITMPMFRRRRRARYTYVAKMSGHRTRIDASVAAEINYGSAIEIRSLCFAKAKWSFYNKLI